MKDKAKHKKGFVLLFAVSLASILLAIAVGVSSIAEKEIRFGTSARDTGSAFFAADTGVECAVFHDKSLVSSFPVAGVESSVTCARTLAPLDFYTTENGGIYYFTLTGLGVNGDGCAKVSVEKDTVSDPTATRTIVISKGYNMGDATCESASPSRVEREIEVSYVVGNPPSGPPPAAGFPVIRGMAQGIKSPAGTTHYITLPGSIAGGDLLLVFFSVNGYNTPTTWPSGWQQIFKQSPSADWDTLEAGFKIAGSSEPLTFQINTSPSSKISAYQSFRITNFNPGVAPVATTSSGQSTTPDPPESVYPTSKKRLWIAVDSRSNGSGITLGYPADYSNNISKATGGGANGTAVDTAVRILETDKTDPGSFTISNNNKWITATVGIEGQPAP